MDNLIEIGIFTIYKDSWMSHKTWCLRDAEKYISLVKTIPYANDHSLYPNYEIKKDSTYVHRDKIEELEKKLGYKVEVLWKWVNVRDV